MSPARKKKEKGKAGADKAATRKTARRATGTSQATGRKGASAGRDSKAAKAKPPDDKKAGSTRKASKEAPKAAAPGASGRRAPTVKSARPRSRKRDAGAAPFFGPAPGGTHPKLGAKYECFECGAKFYDLNRPEPLCPRCGADQRARPKRETKPRHVEEPPRRVEPVPITPLLEDEEADTDIGDDEDLELDLVETDEDFLEEEEEIEEDED